MSNLTTFISESLYPSLYSEIGRLFPQMKFKKQGDKWISPKNIDGTDPTTPRRDKTVVTPRNIRRALENGDGGSKDLITLYKDLNGLHSDIEAIKEIAHDLNISLPESPEDIAKWQEYKAEQERRALSYDRQKKALFSPEGAEVLRYLKENRGYSEDDIKKMGLGYLSPKEGAYLEQETRIGLPAGYRDFPLSIPYFANGSVKGFKLRYISEAARAKYGNNKYRNTQSLNGIMNKNPFGLSPFNVSRGTEGQRIVIAVEGELDALHALAAGLPNVIATAGGKISPEAVATLKEKGYNQVILLLDNDKAGQKYTKESIIALEQAGLSSYIAGFPEGEGKDVDEYLRAHDLEQLKAVIKNHTFGAEYLYNLRKKEYYETQQDGAQNEVELDRFIDDVIAIANFTKDEVRRAKLLDLLVNEFSLNLEEVKKGIKAKADRLKREEQERALRGKIRSSLDTASRLAGGGDLKELDKHIALALDMTQKIEEEDKFSFLLQDNTEELWARYKEVPDSLPTKIELRHREGAALEPYLLTFPSGAISVIGAPTNHGKSKMLQSIALDTLAEMKEGDGTLLYLTYEESEENVNKQFLNAFVNRKLTGASSRGSNIKSISKYLRRGDNDNEDISPAEAPYFLQMEERWKALRRELKIRIVKPEDNYLETLLAILRYATENMKIKAIFLDYIQEVYIERYNKYSSARTDELKEIMVALDLLAQRTNIPLIMAAQIDRKVESPLDLNNNAIADSGWIERKASEIVLIWSNKERFKNDKAEATMEKYEPGIVRNIAPGAGGRLYLKLTKSRLIPTGSWAILEINQHTGRVSGNATKGEPQQKSLSFMGGQDIGGNSKPFGWREEQQKEEQLPPQRAEDDLPF